MLKHQLCHISKAINGCHWKQTFPIFWTFRWKALKEKMKSCRSSHKIWSAFSILSFSFLLFIILFNYNNIYIETSLFMYPSGPELAMLSKLPSNYQCSCLRLQSAGILRGMCCCSYLELHFLTKSSLEHITHKFSVKNLLWGAGDMVQRLRVLAVLAEAQIQFLVPHIGSQLSL